MTSLAEILDNARSDARQELENRELAACLQAGVITPRESISKEDMAVILAQYDPLGPLVGVERYRQQARSANGKRTSGLKKKRKRKRSAHCPICQERFLKQAKNDRTCSGACRQEMQRVAHQQAVREWRLRQSLHREARL